MNVGDLVVVGLYNWKKNEPVLGVVIDIHSHDIQLLSCMQTVSMLTFDVLTEFGKKNYREGDIRTLHDFYAEQDMIENFRKEYFRVRI